MSWPPNREPWRWRPGPRGIPPAGALERMTGRPVQVAEPLPGGLRNTNLKLRLEGLREPVVLRVYEHDPSLCRKEADLLRLLAPSVPVPEVIRAEPDGVGGLPPFALLRFVEGITFLDLKRAGDREAIAQAARSAGEALAAIGRVRFPRSGWIGPGPAVTAPLLEGPDPMPRFIERCLEAGRLSPESAARVRSLAWAHAPEYAALDAVARLVHGDFSRRNLVVRPEGGRWKVAAVLDWEFAVCGSPLADLGSFLRYDRAPSDRAPRDRADAPLAEPHFSEGYRQAGGELPDDWRRLARLLDLAALCAALAKDDLPAEAAQELIALVEQT